MAISRSEPSDDTAAASEPSEGASSTSVSESTKRSRRLRLRKALKKLPRLSKQNWAQLWVQVVQFLKHPLNVALVFWCAIATIATAVLGLFYVGALDSVTTAGTRSDGEEICTQILDALFVLMCLVFHPEILRRSYQVRRWDARDVRELREAFSKGGTAKPHERFHMAVVLFWLNVTCFATYAFAAVYWVFPAGKRPTELTVPTTVISWGAPVLAFLHITVSPLGRTYQLEDNAMIPAEDRAVATTADGRHLERLPTFSIARKAVTSPEWQGYVVLGCCSDPKVAVLSCLFPFCIFGMNAERLGFGQRWVQAMTFALMVFGPYIVFVFSAGTIVFSATFRVIITFIGLALAFLGLLYGAYWRTQMRRSYNLPASRWCLGSKSLTDGMIWMFCCYCALCQEVRTAEYYGIEEGTFFSKGAADEAMEEGLEDEEEAASPSRDAGGQRQGGSADAAPMAAVRPMEQMRV